MKQYRGTLLKSNFKHLQNIEVNLLLFLNVIRKISTLQQNHRNRCASPLVLLIPNYFRDNLKLAILQISNPLTSNLFWNVLFVSPFSQEQLTCNLICQINFNIYKSSHWKWNVFMLRKNHIGPLPKILLIRSWIPFLLTI